MPSTWALVELHRDAERDGAHQRDLVRRRRCPRCRRSGRLRRSPARCASFSTVVEVQALVAHLGQDEVGGAVDDAGDPLDAVGRQAFAQRLDDRDAAGHRGLEGRPSRPWPGAAAKISVPCTASSALLAVTTCLPAAMASSTSVVGDAVAADQLDDDVDLGVGDHVAGVGRPLRTSPPTIAAARARRRGRPPSQSRCRGRRGGGSLPGCGASTLNVPLPTVPMPSRPTLMGFIV